MNHNAAAQHLFETQPAWVRNQCSPTKSIVLNNDGGRIRISWKLPEGWDGEIIIAKDGKSVIMYTFHAKDQTFGPRKHFENEGVFDNNDVFYNLVSVERQETHKRFLAQNPTDRRARANASGVVVECETVASFPFSIFRKFQDRKGNPEQSILIDTIPGLGDWAVGYVERETKEEVVASTRIRRRRGAAPSG